MNRKKPCRPVYTPNAPSAPNAPNAPNAPSAPSAPNAPNAPGNLFNNRQCNLCLKVFSRSNNLKKHIDLKRCKKIGCVKTSIDIGSSDDDAVEFIIEEDDSSDKNNKIVLLEQQLKEVVEKQEKMKQQMEEEQNQMKEQIRDLESKPCTTVNNYYCVLMDADSVKYIFDAYYDETVFWKGPQMVTELLYECMFKKDIKCLDLSRQIFQYKTEVNNQELIVKDVQNYKVLNSISNKYKRMTDFHLSNIVLRPPVDEEDKIDYEISDKATKKADEHYATIDNINQWSNNWLRTVGK